MTSDIKHKNKVNREEKISITWQKKLLFTFATLIFLFIILICLELGLRLGNYGDNLALFVSTPTESSPHYGMNMKVAERYFYYYGDAFDPTPRKDLFLKEKPENGFRIFVLGASTTAGFPYGNNISFPRFLHQRLAEAFPNRRIEIINTAITSVNTYTLLDFMDEILSQEPDLILIYIGHNEFFGPFGPVSGIAFGKYPWVVKSILSLQRYKSFLLMRNIFGPLIRKWTKQISIDPAQGATQSINKDFIEHTLVNYNSDLFEKGLDQYESNLRDILDKARYQNVPVILSELVCNVRDRAPFPAFNSDMNSAAKEAYKKAQQLENQKKYDKARKYYYKAKDLDPIRFRAPEDFNRILHELSEEYNVPIVPMKSFFAKVSPHGLIGDNIILEHVHPDIHGYFVMADAFYDIMRKNNMIEKDWPETARVDPDAFLRNWGITRLDTMAARLATLNLTSGWPFTTESFSTKIARESVIKQFKVVSIADSFALATYENPDYSILSAHYDLARFYKQKGDINRALDEYRALIYSIPTLDFFYEEAVSLLMQIRDLNAAYHLLTNGLKYNRSYKIYRLLGQVCLKMNRLNEGITYSNIAYQRQPDDIQNLGNLIKAYYMQAQFKKGDELLKVYEKNASAAQIIELKNYKNQLMGKIQNAGRLFELAKNSFYAKNYKKAIEKLEQSIKIHDTSLANELMGVIFLRNRQFRNAINYLERARQLAADDNPSLLYNLCLAYLNSDRKKEAYITYLRLKQEYPDFEGINKLGSLLKDSFTDNSN